ncbi:MAG: nuclease [Candidatus Methylumidiphilus alinenensis]|uniref:Nuclease n=1 Tax=Candidatus Methylumidiphilus alinenensis TaxID=2202197 RepID=A0A2W4QHD8_9GAMM|nr:MAG: nuclease [Candidatus Methylumidiphilus alinenensis]
MAFKLIEGTFHVVGYSPDGDSVRFMPNKPETLGLLGGSKSKINSQGHVQLRLEAIDTLETHFQGLHQPLDLAEAAMNKLMGLLEIDSIKWNEADTKVVAANDQTRGFIIAREVEKNGRPVSFAFFGDPIAEDGGDIYIQPDIISKSINAEMLRSGLAYLTYYNGLFSDIRNSLTKISTQARSGGMGVWSRDVTNTGFNVESLQSMTEDYVVLPKLFRRLAAYLEGGGTGQGFKAHLETLQEKVTVISTVHSTHFDTIIEEQGVRILMTEQPENLIFAG